MSATLFLLDKYKAACSLPSDNQAALKLGISRSTISAWRKGRNEAEPENVELMAKACGLDVEEWVLRVQAERDGKINPKRAQVWLRCAERISGTAAAIALAFGLAVYTPESHASERVYDNGTAIHYAHSPVVCPRAGVVTYLKASSLQ